MKTFEEVWAEKEKEGYQYGDDALEQVRFGWELREPEIRELTEALAEAERKDDMLASVNLSVLRERDEAEYAVKHLSARIQELEGWYARAMGDVADLNKSRGASETELADLRKRIQLAREHVSNRTFTAFEPKSDDQATNAGRFAVALYLLKEIKRALHG